MYFLVMPTNPCGEPLENNFIIKVFSNDELHFQYIFPPWWEDYSSRVLEWITEINVVIIDLSKSLFAFFKIGNELP